MAGILARVYRGGTEQGVNTTSPPDAAPEGGNSGGVVLVDIADATYTTGTAQVEVTGQQRLSADGTLLPGASLTNGGTTLLMYGAGEGEDAVVISISNGPETGLAMTISAAALITGGDGSSGCGFEFSRNDERGLAGTFSCRGLSTVGLDTATVDVSGTFTAER